MERRPLWNVSVRRNGKIIVYEFDGETEEYVRFRVRRSELGEIVKVERVG